MEKKMEATIEVDILNILVLGLELRVKVAATP